MGLSQKEFARRAEISNQTLVRLERYESTPQPATIKKLADALGMTFDELERDLVEGSKRVQETTNEKVAVTTKWLDEEERTQGETLRFLGEEVYCYDYEYKRWTLYECPGGYRVFVEDDDTGTAALHPRAGGPGNNAVYLTYRSAKELVEDFPMFGEAVGVYPVRDLD